MGCIKQPFLFYIKNIIIIYYSIGKQNKYIKEIDKMKQFMKRDKELNNEVMDEIHNNFIAYDFTRPQIIQPQNISNGYEMCLNNSFINLEVTEEDILDNKEIRKNMLDRTSVLDKIKGLVLISKLNYCTLRMVSEYFEIDYHTLDKCIQRNEDEFDNGLIKKTGREIIELINNSVSSDIKSVQKSNNDINTHKGVLLTIMKILITNPTPY